MKIFSKIWQSAVVATLLFTPFLWAKVTIYLCGDSTMQDWAEGYYPKQGQGQDFHYWFDSGLADVVNRGQGGMAAEGYYDMFWKSGCSAGNCIADKIKAGDYVIIQFGINDRNKSTNEKYNASMTAMFNETRAKGAYPIIMSPIRRCYFFNNDSIYESYHEYPWLARELSESLDVPMIDMDTLARNYMLSLGYTYTSQFVFNHATKAEYSNLGSDQADDVHLQMNGANAYGRIITEQMRVHKDPIVKKLGDYMAPMYQVSVKVSPAGSDSATSISAYYPEGMTVMLKTIPKNGKKFLGWYDGNGNKVSGNSVSSVSSPNIHTFVMKNASTQFTAVYEGGNAEKYTGDGKALTEFPTGTPKSLDDVTFEPFTPIGGSGENDVKVDKNIKNFFDAFIPDSGIGYSESNNAGFHGEGFWNFANEKNSYGSYRIKFPGAGYVTLAIIYANGGTTDRMINAYLDHDYYISAPPTGSWTTWDTAYVVMDAPLGEAELRFMSLTSDGGPNIDMFGFSVENVCRVSEGCPEEPQVLPFSKAMNFAKLNGNVLEIVGDLNSQIKIFDMQGRLIAKTISNAKSIDLSKLVSSNGIYRLVVKSAGKKFMTTWVKAF